MGQYPRVVMCHTGSAPASSSGDAGIRNVPAWWTRPLNTECSGASETVTTVHTSPMPDSIGLLSNERDRPSLVGEGPTRDYCASVMGWSCQKELLSALNVNQSLGNLRTIAKSLDGGMAELKGHLA